MRRLDPASVLWVSDGGEEGATPRPAVRRMLGASFDAVVLDLHPGADADEIGQVHGFVRGGGGLILRLGRRGAFSPSAKLQVFPHPSFEVGVRFDRRLERCLDEGTTEEPSAPLHPCPWPERGTDEQVQLVERLVSDLARPGACSVVLADRGRGKSSALGIALSRLPDSIRVAVSGPSPASAAEVLRFAGPRSSAGFVEPSRLFGEGEYDVVIVDEAAQIPLPILRRIVDRHPRARLVFASTNRGYEGTGRGFVMRFLQWLGATRADLMIHRLSQPIRWAEGDPVETVVWRALLLDAEAPVPPSIRSPVRHVVLERDELAGDETRLREIFGLLLHAHYRTTPSDLQRLLDAPNLDVHVLLEGARTVGAALVAKEGRLPSSICHEVAHDGRRLRGHALPETLMCHGTCPEAGELAYLRSVRIAVPSGRRREGLASQLVDAVHEIYSPDLFGTIFGATPELVRFRQAVGYHLVRLGGSLGRRTGEPAVVMVRPVTPAGWRLFGRLRKELARSLALQLELLRADGAWVGSAELTSLLHSDVGAAEPLTDYEMRRAVEAFAHGPRSYEASAHAVAAFVDSHGSLLSALSDVERTAVVGRVIQRESWSAVSVTAGQPSVPATMRLVRRAIGRMLSDASPSTGR